MLGVNILSLCYDFLDFPNNPYCALIGLERLREVLIRELRLPSTIPI